MKYAEEKEEQVCFSFFSYIIYLTIPWLGENEVASDYRNIYWQLIVFQEWQRTVLCVCRFGKSLHTLMPDI
jgi:hypothetical protein